MTPPPSPYTSSSQLCRRNPPSIVYYGGEWGSGRSCPSPLKLPSSSSSSITSFYLYLPRRRRIRIFFRGPKSDLGIIDRAPRRERSEGGGVLFFRGGGSRQRRRIPPPTLARRVGVSTEIESQGAIFLGWSCWWRNVYALAHMFMHFSPPSQEFVLRRRSTLSKSHTRISPPHPCSCEICSSSGACSFSPSRDERGGGARTKMEKNSFSCLFCSLSASFFSTAAPNQY